MELHPSLRENVCLLGEQPAIENISEIKQITELLESEPAIARSLAVRHPYMEPLHVVQAELLRRDRESPQ